MSDKGAYDQTRSRTVHSKERPICRKLIIKHGFRPAVYTDPGHRPLRTGEMWDGFTAINRDDAFGLSAGLRIQMRRMLAQGYFDQGDES